MVAEVGVLPSSVLVLHPQQVVKSSSCAPLPCAPVVDDYSFPAGIQLEASQAPAPLQALVARQQPAEMSEAQPLS